MILRQQAGDTWKRLEQLDVCRSDREHKVKSRCITELPH